MAKIKLEINNNKIKLNGPLKILNQLDKDFSIRNPNAWHIRKYMGKGWDGKQHYITEAGYIKTGLLPKLVKKIEEHGHEVEFEDYRAPLPEWTFPKKVGEHTPRDYQEEAIRAVLENEVNGLHFPIGVVNAATNAGKTTIAAGIFLAYKAQIPAIILVNDGDLYTQFLDELPKLVGEENFGYVRGKDKNWNKFTLGMVQSISQNASNYALELSKFRICLVDEADLADNKTYKRVIEKLYNTNIRVGLSGTIYMSKLAKDKIKNENLRCFFSDEVFKITKREMVDKGLSTELVIKIIRGNTKPGIKGDFKAEYDELITNNEDRHMVSMERARWNAERGRLPMVIICQYHQHIENLYNVYIRELGYRYKVERVHHETKNRTQIFKDFRDGKIDILISSYIIKRGKNLPLTKYLQNASSSDSNETISQLMGRLERTHESKNKSYIDDLFDEGHYLKRHSKHRIAYYRKEKFKVIVKV